MDPVVVQGVFLFLSVLVAGGLVLHFSKIKKYSFKLLFLFGGAFIFGLTLAHILPEVFESDLSAPVAGFWVILGFIAQFFIERLTQGIDHGEEVPQKERMLSPWSLLLGLCLHAFLEGAYLGIPNPHSGHGHLFWGIVLHKIPAAVALAALMSSHWQFSKKVWIGLACFSIAAPLGIFISRFLWANQWFSGAVFEGMVAFVAGGFLFISTSLFSALRHTDTQQLKKAAAIVLGLVLALGLEVL